MLWPTGLSATMCSFCIFICTVLLVMQLLFPGQLISCLDTVFSLNVVSVCCENDLTYFYFICAPFLQARQGQEGQTIGELATLPMEERGGDTPPLYSLVLSPSAGREQSSGADGGSCPSICCRAGAGPETVSVERCCWRFRDQRMLWDL